MVAGRHQWSREACDESLWRRLLGQVQGRWCPALRRRKGEGADQGLRKAGGFQDDFYRDPARSSERASAATVLEADWCQYGDRTDRSGELPSARVHAPVSDNRMAYRRSRRSRSADVRQFPHRKPGRTRQLFRSRAGSPARARPHHGRRRQAYRGLLRDQPTDQQGSDLVLELPEHLLCDLDVETERLAEKVQRGDRRIQRLDGIAWYARLRRSKAPLPDPRIAVDIPDRLA